jgi:hypothetical protein
MLVEVTSFFIIVIRNIIDLFLCWDYGGSSLLFSLSRCPSPLPFPALYGVWFVIGSKQSRLGLCDGGGVKVCRGEIPVGGISASCY